MTYSIVARDPDSGQLGVAVQSHYFQVGPVVPWAESGVGAVATQSRVDVRHGPLGLQLMRAGHPAPRALAASLAADPEPELRQVAMVDARGVAAAHTGSRCIAEAGHRLGPGFSVQANLMERATVWDAMAEAYAGAAGPLAERMLEALDAAEAEGGDIRGRQSAAILVVAGSTSRRSWEDRLLDLRVDDHPEPLAELRRLLRVKRAYQALDAGRGEEAIELLPDQPEIRFWAAIARAEAGDLQSAATLLGDIVRSDRRWLETLRRLVPAGRLDAAPAAELGRLLGQAPSR